MLFRCYHVCEKDKMPYLNFNINMFQKKNLLKPLLLQDLIFTLVIISQLWHIKYLFSPLIYIMVQYIVYNAMIFKTDIRPIVMNSHFITLI